MSENPQEQTEAKLLAFIEGELDDISGAGQTRAAHDLCSGIPPSRQFHYDVMGAGHYGIFSGRRWREHCYPQLRDFIASHQSPSSGSKRLSRSASTPVPVAAAKTEGSAKSTKSVGDKTAN